MWRPGPPGYILKADWPDFPDFDEIVKDRSPVPICPRWRLTVPRAAGCRSRDIYQSFYKGVVRPARDYRAPSRPGVSEGKCGVTIEEMMDSRRSLEEALADLLVTYERGPNPALARTIELMRAEIEIREQRGSPFSQNG